MKMNTTSKNQPEQEAFIAKSSVTLSKMHDMLRNLPVAKWEDFSLEQTALVIVDLINGFAKEGSLMSPRVDAVVPEIETMARHVRSKGMAVVAFADAHVSSSPEFESYPVHCLAGTRESELVDELKGIKGIELIQKNSTNGFLEPAFQSWLASHPWIKTFIVVGDCTDICIYQFSTTLKCWFNRMNMPVDIVVPYQAVDTYDYDIHDGDLLDAVFLYGMSCNGIRLVRSIYE